MPDTRESVEVFSAGAATVATLAERVDMPFNGDIANVTLDVGTAPTGANLQYDVLDGGTSIFSAATGTLINAVGTGDTTLVISQASGMSLPRQNQILLIGSEMVQVTDPPAGNQGQTQGNPEYTLTVTRAYGGTSAATHAAGAAVSPAKPQVVAAATNTGTAVFAPSKGAGGAGTPPISAGDVITFQCLQIGSTVAGSDVTITLELIPR